MAKLLKLVKGLLVDGLVKCTGPLRQILLNRAFHIIQSDITALLYQEFSNVLQNGICESTYHIFISTIYTV
jgi:hypothetical protein